MTKTTKPADRRWQKGAPPHVGWWNASNARLTDAWRWWNGAEWSYAAYENYCAKSAGRDAKKIPNQAIQYAIEWTDFYPADARVPRLDPTGGHWTFNTEGKMPTILAPCDKVEFAMPDGVPHQASAGTLRWREPSLIVAWRLAA
jgi:hypothetical protein